MCYDCPNGWVCEMRWVPSPRLVSVFVLLVKLHRSNQRLSISALLNALDMIQAHTLLCLT